MIQLPTHIQPDPAVLDELQAYQNQIVGTFSEKQTLAKSKFKSRNKKGNRAFDSIKEKLTPILMLYLSNVQKRYFGKKYLNN